MSRGNNKVLAFWGLIILSVVLALVFVPGFGQAVGRAIECAVFTCVKVVP